MAILILFQKIIKSSTKTCMLIRPVVPGCAGYAMAHPDFGRSVNPFQLGGSDYAHLITTGTPEFSDLPTALYVSNIF